jgi:hypothetical protein
VFKPSTREEGARRKIEGRKAKLRDFIEEIVSKSKKGPDGGLIVNGDIRLSYEDVGSFENLGLKISRVNGSVILERCSLTTLKGSPQYVSGDFDVSNNQITSLEGCPQFIGGTLDISDNQLRSLAGCPQKLSSFSCGRNQFTTLEGGPQIVSGNYSCRRSQITTLRGIAKKIGGSADFSENRSLTDFAPIFSTEIVGSLTLPKESSVNLKALDWRKIRVGRGVKIQDSVTHEIVERLESDVLRFLKPLFAHISPKLSSYDRSNTGGRLPPLQFDKITDDDIDVSENPSEILKKLKSGGFEGYYIFWILMTFQGKEEKAYKPDRRWRNPLENVTLPYLLATTKGKEVIQQGDKFKMYNHLKTISDFADIAVIIPFDKFQATQMRQDRQVAKQGAASMMSNEEIRDANRKRYHELLVNKRASVDFIQASKEYMMLITELAFNIYAKKENLSDYEIIGSNDGSPRVQKVTDPAGTIQSMLNWGWRLIDEYNRYSQDARDDEYYQKKIANMKSNIKFTLDNIKNKKITYVSMR